MMRPEGRGNNTNRACIENHPKDLHNAVSAGLVSIPITL